MAAVSGASEPAPHLVTFCGLEEWTEHMFKHLGHMACAKAGGDTGRVKEYLRCLDQLIEALGTNTFTEADRNRDVGLLLEDAKTLKEAATKLLGGSATTGGRRQRQRERSRRRERSRDDRRRERSRDDRRRERSRRRF